ncbi:MAG TPA: hypothetical protein VH092_37385, partial [Urbifossiella sp.]|nr:hypothetical protein [Urbifossiella sp.]
PLQAARRDRRAARRGVFAAVEDGWADGSRRNFVEQGLELGAYVFDRLYRDLLAEGRTRTSVYRPA